MKTIKVSLAANEYEVQIGPGLLKETGAKLRGLGFKNKAVIITNPIVNKPYGEPLKGSLEIAGFDTAVLEVPDGERFKSLTQASKLYEQLGDFQAERMTPVIALGGGVIGDLSGFVAATYMRGVPLVHVPTTLLAQVDSSIGGKTAVNHGKLKNNIGAFYQPVLVISDTNTLNTLPQVEFKNGLAEVIKYGIIRDKALIQLLEHSIQSIDEIICRCASIKSEIIVKDEKDTGLRNILNYGHTIGHAIEIISNYKVKHGQGVAIGMVAAAMISQRMGYLSSKNLEIIRTVIARAGLPVKTRKVFVEDILHAMQHDKKKAGGKIRFILPAAIGEVFICDEVKLDLVEQVLRDING